MATGIGLISEPLDGFGDAAGVPGAETPATEAATRRCEHEGGTGREPVSRFGSRERMRQLDERRAAAGLRPA
ncbi:hypothetical protein K3N28_10295 [Glycomyces sp. TRM65418]|uniref:hypothetical protein n=1 Tax=Glycomyces sp. TRM65418 TaxID=2867006 RepID=UPI001CE67339|nr:hypothetical protein [Glycomyces sp. TRM65418]MCC3763463.1 hypothetical protein [Glycomyces sp. TRM65418]QZD57451.1 hypothetical protein K3N28_10235 [Glycomyces sp. TRM65418]